MVDEKAIGVEDIQKTLLPAIKELLKKVKH